MHSVIDPATVLAYRQTEYRVLGSLPALLQVGVHCAQLALLHRKFRTDCSAFVTACNPWGERVADALNAGRQAALAAQLSRQGCVAIEGIGQHPTGEWPAEASYLVPGLPRNAAQQLGRQFEQNAILWAGSDAVPELILLR